MSVLNINIEELLKELDPATLQALQQLLAEDAPAVRKTIQNILDEPISEKAEKSLDKPFNFLNLFNRLLLLVKEGGEKHKKF